MKSRYTDSQTLEIPKQVEADAPMPELCPKHGMNRLTSIAVAAVLPLFSGGISAAPPGAAMQTYQVTSMTDADFYDNGRPPAAKVALGEC